MGSKIEKSKNKNSKGSPKALPAKKEEKKAAIPLKVVGKKAAQEPELPLGDKAKKSGEKKASDKPKLSLRDKTTGGIARSLRVVTRLEQRLFDWKTRQPGVTELAVLANAVRSAKTSMALAQKAMLELPADWSPPAGRGPSKSSHFAEGARIVPKAKYVSQYEELFEGESEDVLIVVAVIAGGKKVKAKLSSGVLVVVNAAEMESEDASLEEDEEDEDGEDEEEEEETAPPKPAAAASPDDEEEEDDEEDEDE